jgi:hypothetical protein
MSPEKFTVTMAWSVSVSLYNIVLLIDMNIKWAKLYLLIATIHTQVNSSTFLY